MMTDGYVWAAEVAMIVSRLGLAAVSVAAMAMAGCSSTRFSSMDSVQPAPLPAAPSGTISSSQLPPPVQPNASDPSQFPIAPGQGTQVASLPPDGQPPAAAADISKSTMVGSWRTSVSGSSCQMFMTLTKFGNASRGGTRGCPGDMANMKSWDVQGKQVVIYDQNGGTLARLYSSGGEKFDGQTSSGQPISLTR
jgi:hypothetical protein